MEKEELSPKEFKLAKKLSRRIIKKIAAIGKKKLVKPDDFPMTAPTLILLVRLGIADMDCPIEVLLRKFDPILKSVGDQANIPNLPPDRAELVRKMLVQMLSDAEEYEFLSELTQSKKTTTEEV